MATLYRLKSWTASIPSIASRGPISSSAAITDLIPSEDGSSSLDGRAATACWNKRKPNSWLEQPVAWRSMSLAVAPATGPGCASDGSAGFGGAVIASAALSPRGRSDSGVSGVETAQAARRGR